MTTSIDLEKRIRILEDIEAIKKLKVRYWSSVDGQRWEDLAGCLAAGFVFESPQFARMEGRDYIVKVLKRAMRTVTTAHQGHNPVIEITGENTARGTWSLNDQVRTSDDRFLNGYGIYEDEYIRENGGWKISSSKLRYIFQHNTGISQ
jgi:hypothetical protein